VAGVSTLLEILDRAGIFLSPYFYNMTFQPSLRFYIKSHPICDRLFSRYMFQPSLRFYRPRLWLWWVFKFFFGFFVFSAVGFLPCQTNLSIQKGGVLNCVFSPS
jgi:hypothetical protein